MFIYNGKQINKDLTIIQAGLVDNSIINVISLDVSLKRV